MAKRITLVEVQRELHNQIGERMKQAIGQVIAANSILVGYTDNVRSVSWSQDGSMVQPPVVRIPTIKVSPIYGLLGSSR
jgi:hypothetical protein